MCMCMYVIQNRQEKNMDLRLLNENGENTIKIISVMEKINKESEKSGVGHS